MIITKALKTAVSGNVFGWKRPAHLILHVTSFCNARCGMCFAWRRLNKAGDLTLGEITKIARSLPDLTFLDISGGEPFLRDDLDKILKVFSRTSPGAYVNLPTNGILTEKIATLTKKMLTTCTLPISLNLSLDGLAKTHDRIRGVEGCFDKVLKTYDRLAEIKASNPRLSLKVATVISNQNFNEFAKLAEFVKKRMPEIDFQTLILIRGEPKDSAFSLPPLKELLKKKPAFIKIWKSYGYGKNLGKVGSRVGNVSHNYLLNLYLQTLRNKRMALPCLAGRAHGVVYANADLAFCELRPVIGNLRRVNFDFKTLWYGQEAEKQRQEIAKNACYCTHGCNWTDNLFFNPKTYPKLTWELIKGLY